VVNLLKELADIALENKPMPIGKLPTTFPRRGCSFPYLTRVCAGDKPPLQNRLQQVAQRVVHHTIPEWRGRNQTSFGFMDLEKPVLAGAILAGKQFASQGKDFGLAPQPPRFDVRPPRLVPPGLGGRIEQVADIGNGVHVADLPQLANAQPSQVSGRHAA